MIVRILHLEPHPLPIPRQRPTRDIPVARTVDRRLHAGRHGGKQVLERGAREIGGGGDGGGGEVEQEEEGARVGDAPDCFAGVAGGE